MTVIDDYLANIPAPQKAALEQIRTVVHDTAPGAEEVISYGMPGFKYKGKYLMGFNAFKDHLSIFPTSEPVEVLQDKLTEFKQSKGTIQFTLEHPVPEPIIQELIRIRMATIDAGAKY